MFARFVGTLRTRSSTQVMVAMKFTPEYNKHHAQEEYQMYTYLGAIQNSSVEAFGIPSVYYYGQWQDLYLMAITLLDSQSYEMSGDDGIVNQVDVLIVFREFVSRSKALPMKSFMIISTFPLR